MPRQPVSFVLEYEIRPRTPMTGRYCTGPTSVPSFCLPFTDVAAFLGTKSPLVAGEQ